MRDPKITENRLIAAHVDKALNIGHTGVEDLVRRFTDNQAQLLITGSDTDAQILEERRQTLSALRRKIQDMAEMLEPVNGYLD